MNDEEDDEEDDSSLDSNEEFVVPGNEEGQASTSWMGGPSQQLDSVPSIDEEDTESEPSDEQSAMQHDSEEDTLGVNDQYFKFNQFKFPGVKLDDLE